MSPGVVKPLKLSSVLTCISIHISLRTMRWDWQRRAQWVSLMREGLVRTLLYRFSDQPPLCSCSCVFLASCPLYLNYVQENYHSSSSGDWILDIENFDHGGCLCNICHLNPSFCWSYCLIKPCHKTHGTLRERHEMQVLEFPAALFPSHLMNCCLVGHNENSILCNKKKI